MEGRCGGGRILELGLVQQLLFCALVAHHLNGAQGVHGVHTLVRVAARLGQEPACSKWSLAFLLQKINQKASNL
jgi:hypothetical protein